MSRSETIQEMIGRRAAAARAQANLSLEDASRFLAESMGRAKPFTPMKFSSVEHGKWISLDTLYGLSTMFGRPVDYFIAPEAEAQRLNIDVRLIRALPLLPFEDVGKDIEDIAAEALSENRVHRMVGYLSGDFACLMPDDSMTPIFEANKTVLIIEKHTALDDLAPGRDIALIKMTYKTYVRRVRYENDSVVFEPANPTHRKFTLPLAKYEALQPLIGVVVASETRF